MQGAIVMAIALSGLGCANKSCELSDAPPACSSTDRAHAKPYPSYASSYSGYYSRSYGGHDSPAQISHLGGLRANLYNFVFGHDPNVATAREIEESVYGRGSGD